MYGMMRVDEFGKVWIYQRYIIPLEGAKKINGQWVGPMKEEGQWVPLEDD